MAIYKKGRDKPYNGPYSKDFEESKVIGLGRDTYNPADTVAEARAGKFSKNTQTPAPFSFQDDTVDVDSGIAPATHIRGGFPSAVSKSSNHPGYKRQPR